MRRLQRKTWTLAFLASSTLFTGQCVTDIRDAFIGGALDYLTGSTTSLIDAWFPFATWLAPPTIEIPEPDEA